MKREFARWYSHRLQKDMDIVTYGHYGTPLLMFPTAGADFLEYERFQLLDTISPYIESGKIKAFSINSINNETWLRNWGSGRDKSLRHEAYFHYVVEEVVPFIHNQCGGWQPIITTGASLGALHAANHFFRRPDLFRSLIAMSGSYDLHDYTKGYSDDLTYHNSPVLYMQNWHDAYWWNLHANNNGIIIATGQGDFEKPSATAWISDVLNKRSIPHWADFWGYDQRHDWPTWRSMLPYFLGRIVG